MGDVLRHGPASARDLPLQHGTAAGEAERLEHGAVRLQLIDEGGDGVGLAGHGDSRGTQASRLAWGMAAWPG